MSHQKQIQPIAGGLLHPLPKRDFFEQYWEQKPLHIDRSTSDDRSTSNVRSTSNAESASNTRLASNQFDQLISEQAIESLLSTHSLAYPTVQLSKTGHVIPVDTYTDANQFIVNERIVDGYQSGCTIVMSLVQKLHPPLMQFCRQVQSEFGMPCQTNVYLSPPGNQGFNPHYDTHDVFILQVSGKKTFSFYDGGAHLPTATERFNKEIHSVGEKTEEIELSAGDTLYIPRGFVHDAVADSELASLHITLGVYPMLMQTLVSKILDNAAKADVRLRQSILNPQEGANTSSIGNSIDTEHLRQMLLDQINDDNIHHALHDLLDEDALDAKLDLAGQLSATPSKTTSLSTEFQVRHESIIDVSREQSQLKLRTHGALLSVNDPVSQAIEWCLRQSSLQAGQIPALNDDQRMALVKQLMAHGVLQQV